MRLLLDQNLSPRLVSRLAEAYPGICHVSEWDWASATDVEVWEAARREEVLRGHVQDIQAFSAWNEAGLLFLD